MSVQMQEDAGRDVRAGASGANPSRVQVMGPTGMQEGREGFQFQGIKRNAPSVRSLNEAFRKSETAKFKEEYRFDVDAVLTEMMSDVRFSKHTFERNFRESARRMGFREANSSAAFSQLLRMGVSKMADEGYELEPATFETDIAEVIPSKGFENYYAPMYRPQRGGPVSRGQSYPAISMSALDFTIRNYKFGAILEVEGELVEDDQTGQIVQQGTMIGESLSYEIDMYGYAQMAAATWVVSVVTNTGAITTPQVSEAHRLLRKVHDPNGNLMVVRPDTLLVDTDEEIPAIQILDSLVAAQNPGASPAAGSVIYFGVINPLRGKYKLVATPFVTEALKSSSNANGYGTDNATPAKWLMRAKRRIVFQPRTPLEVIPEVANSGENFQSDTLRYKGKMRFGADVVDSRYACRLN